VSIHVRSTKPSEAGFQQTVLELAKATGWRRAHFRKVRVQRKSGKTFWETPVAGDGKGFLDLLLLRDKRLIVAELKMPREKMKPEQELWFAAWQEFGAETYLWYPEDWDEIQKILE
jgi:hypothetical protein